MKKQISVCIFLSIILIVLSLTFIRFNNEKKEKQEADNTQLMEITQKAQMQMEEPTESETELPYLFCIQEKDNRLVVYEEKTGSVYMETGIMASDLPQELYETLKKDGIFFETEADLYDFLESYSS